MFINLFWLLNAIQVSIKTINHSMALYASEIITSICSDYRIMGLSQNGYYAINLQKNPLDENVIPLEYYDDSNESLNDILYTVYIVL